MSADYDPVEGVSENLSRNRYREALQGLLRREDGRTVLKEILARARILQPGVMDEHGIGQRDFGLRLLDDIKAISPADAAGILFEERTR